MTKPAEPPRRFVEPAVSTRLYFEKPVIDFLEVVWVARSKMMTDLRLHAMGLKQKADNKTFRDAYANLFTPEASKARDELIEKARLLFHPYVMPPA